MTKACLWDSPKYSPKWGIPNRHKYWTLIAWIQLGRRNIPEPQKKTVILCFYFPFLFWKSLYIHLHMLWDPAFVYIQFLTSICQLCNCGQASRHLRLVGLLSRILSERLSSDLCFPAERIHVFGGSYWINNAKTYSAKHTVERALVNFRYHLRHGQHLLTEDAAFLWKVKTRRITFSWKSHSDSRCYFALY